MSFRTSKSHERGYILLALLLFVALLSIGVFVSIQRIDLQIRRDREEELIHRGVQYSRAVRKYFKAFGRYPTRIEDLESTNQQRFLRRRYKDPITGKDFKVLHFTDVRLSFGATPGVPVSQGNKPESSDDSSSDDSAATTNADSDSSTASTSTASQGQGSAGDSSQATQGPGTGPATGTGAGTAVAATSQSAAQQSGTQQSATQPADSSKPPQVFGGAGIVGVVSLSKDRTIREFNKKNRYNQWQFIYDPTTDRGGLLMTPNQPPLMGNTSVSQPQTGTGASPTVLGPGGSPTQPNQK